MKNVFAIKKKSCNDADAAPDFLMCNSSRFQAHARIYFHVITSSIAYNKKLFFFIVSWKRPIGMSIDSGGDFLSPSWLQLSNDSTIWCNWWIEICSLLWSFFLVFAGGKITAMRRNECSQAPGTKLSGQLDSSSVPFTRRLPQLNLCNFLLPPAFTATIEIIQLETDLSQL